MLVFQVDTNISREYLTLLAWDRTSEASMAKKTSKKYSFPLQWLLLLRILAQLCRRYKIYHYIGGTYFCITNLLY